MIIINRDADKEQTEKLGLEQEVVSPEERHQRGYLASRIIAECGGILDDHEAVHMFFDVINFMKRESISEGRIGKLYSGMAKELMPTAMRVFKQYMDDYLVHYDEVAYKAICFASTTREIPDHVVDLNPQIYNLYDQMVDTSFKQDKERYFSLRERMVAECRLILDDYEAMEMVFNIVLFMRRRLLQGNGLNCVKRPWSWKKIFFMQRVKRHYFCEVKKVIPIAKKVYMLLSAEHTLCCEVEKINSAFISAASRLIYATKYKKAASGIGTPMPP